MAMYLKAKTKIVVIAIIALIAIFPAYSVEWEEM
jgi:membrane protein required for beta-lactamase induction